MTWLREQVMRGRESTPLNPRRIERATPIDDLVVDVAFWWSQPRLANLGMLFRAPGRTEALPVTIALWDDGTNALSRHLEWLRAECAKGRAVLVLNLSGMGPLQPAPLNAQPPEALPAFRKLADDLFFLGDSLVALRTYETLRALDVLAEWPGVSTGDVRVQADGRIGVHGRLAAALDARITRSEWSNGFRFADFVRNRNYDSTNIRSVLLPGALRYFDLDEL